MSPTFFIHTFGCQMNQADTEIITAILTEGGYAPAEDEHSADMVLLNTCAVRANAVDRAGNVLSHLKGMKRRRKGLVVGLLGCVPQYEREQLFSDFPFVDFIVGPDNYRDLCGIVRSVRDGVRQQSRIDYDQQETYAGIEPVRASRISTFLPVMRGCNNHCAFCVVSVTRGRERSVAFDRVIAEVTGLEKAGYREVTLLGQNVNSWRDAGKELDFAGLLEGVSHAVPSMRIRFTTSHPKDISESLVRVIGERPNLCNHIHLPVQSGSSRMLDLMKRGHTREEYLDKIAMIRDLVPGAAITTDLIAGFCTETEEDHRQTLSLMEAVGYDTAFMFYYSVRPGTWAARNLPDDVPEAVKKARLQEIIELQTAMSRDLYQREIGKTVEVLAEAESKRSPSKLMGRTATNRAVVFDRKSFKPGDHVQVRITAATSATLSGEAVSPEVSKSAL
ncbi:MAG: tRNA (N6-isopentenyl adenosine(37)-C2)-methylthiotransferase MiaB [Chlorobiaceae bacterium]|nr:tRNA (N6-isopentenyl adenosine(37)-C2)-methylthiotransferase MiaB [Chlorobiaceae bacterium]